MKTRSITAVRRSVCSLVAIAALLAQALVPHVHVRAERLGPVAAEVVACAAAHCTSLSSSTDAADQAPHQHAGGCPLCRAQSDARSLLLPAALAVPLPTAASSPFSGAAVIGGATVSRTLAAPRAPPAVS